MTQFLRLLRLFAFMLISLSPAYATASDWVVARTTKQVSYTLDKKTWDAVEVGTVIPSKAWISTGPRGRVTLTRGEESLSLSPNTLGGVITSQGLFSRKTEVVQQTGKIALNIEKKSKPHTYVHTPFLAAVVKGTTFTVTVTDKNASVSVEEGLVQVSSFTSGESANVGPGQTATVDQAQNMSVAGVVEAPSVFSVEPTRASVPAVGQPAPVGADLGLSSSADQSASSSAGAESTEGSNGVSGESSEGGNGNGNAGGNGNGNAGGNGNGNAGGNGNGNAGGNGNGNAGGNGNGNAGGNGNGNAGGNGNGNAGGNGNGNGNGGKPN